MTDEERMRELLDIDILRALRVGVQRGLVRIAKSCERLQLRGLIFLDHSVSRHVCPLWKLTATGGLELKKYEGGGRVAS